MEKKELQKQKELLLKELHAEEKKLKDSEHKLSLYEYEEAKKAEAAVKKAPAKKKTTKKTKVKSTSSSKNKGANRQNMKKHVIVPASELNHYDFEQRKKDWHAKSGMNEKQEVCSICGDDDNWESILLDNNKHVCYYCWIKKPNESKAAIVKQESKNAKAVETKKETSIETTNESESVGKLFYIIAITLGILLVALIIIIVLGIISSWDFKF